jgi:adenosine kinase
MVIGIQMSVLVCGSVAYDTLLNFEGVFSDQILANQLHKLSTTLKVPVMRREFGGCAGNIAYNLNLLGIKPLIMAAVGDDFEPYRMHLHHLDIVDTYIHQAAGQFTSQCFIISDRKGSQIAAFHPGAMDFGTENHIHDLQDQIKLAVMAPCGYRSFLQHCQELADRHIPFIFDPSQELPLFSTEELKQMIRQATWLTLNDYEIELMQERTGWGIDHLRTQVEALIITRGARGSEIYTGEEVISIPRAHMDALPVDPAGCGDAYRAGLVYGILKGWGWKKTGQLANVLGGIKVTSGGAQNHHFTWKSLAQVYEKSYGEALELPL